MVEIIKLLDIIINNPKYTWAIVSLTAFILVMISIIRLHLSKDYHKFNLVTLMAIDTTTSEPSDSKFRLNIAFVITAWAFIYLTMSDKLTEWYVAGFLMAWVTDRQMARNATIKQMEMNKDKP